MTFASSGVSPGSSLHLGLILLAGFSLLLLANRIAGGRFIRGGPLDALSHVLNHRRPFLERVLILGTSPLASKLIEEIGAQAHPRFTIVGVVGDEAGLCELPFLYFPGGPLEQLGKIVDLVRAHPIIVALQGRGAWARCQLLQAATRGNVGGGGGEGYQCP